MTEQQKVGRGEAAQEKEPQAGVESPRSGNTSVPSIASPSGNLSIDMGKVIQRDFGLANLPNDPLPPAEEVAEILGYADRAKSELGEETESQKMRY
jgi:hypothetical protein